MDSPYSRFVISQSQMKLTVDPEKANARYLYYYFRLHSTVEAIQSLAISSGVPHINLDILRKFQVVTPPVSIQLKVAAVVSAYDELIEKGNRRIALLEKLAEEIYREWFVRFRFPGYDKVKVTKGVPEGWAVKKLGDLVRTQYGYLRGVLDAIIQQKDIDAVTLRVGELLDESLVVDDEGGLREGAAEFRIQQSGKTWDLSKINFDKLKADFQQVKYKNIEIADLRAFIQHKLEQMLKENSTRADFAIRLQGIVDGYNAGSSSADNYFEELIRFTKDLKEESERCIREGLTEDELELFDLLKKDKMTAEETKKARLAAKALLHRLLEESPKVLVQDWFKDQQSKIRVRSTVESVLDSHLPKSYDRVVFTEKCNNVFDLMVNYASQGLKWAA
jgi:hypothetical protein